MKKTTLPLNQKSFLIEENGLNYEDEKVWAKKSRKENLAKICLHSGQGRVAEESRASLKAYGPVSTASCQKIFGHKQCSLMKIATKYNHFKRNLGKS